MNYTFSGGHDGTVGLVTSNKNIAGIISGIVAGDQGAVNSFTAAFKADRLPSPTTAITTTGAQHIPAKQPSGRAGGIV